MAILKDVLVEEAGGLLGVGLDIVDEILVRKTFGVYTYYRTKEHGSILVKRARGVTVWIEAPAPAVSSGFIFRLLTKGDEDSLQEAGTITPKNYFGEVTAEGHVLHGGRPSYSGSRFLSASKDIEGVYRYVAGLLGRGAVRKDRLERLESTVIAVADISRLQEAGIRCIDVAPLMRGIMSRRFVEAVREVLVDGEIPEAALHDFELLSLDRVIERR